MAAEIVQQNLLENAPHDIDLGGDVNLLVGPNGCQVRLKVSKALLSFASKYFSAVFNGQYQEKRAVEDGQDVILRDDEPDAVVNLLKILHMKFTWPKPMSPLELLHLAIVADKYACVNAINLSLETLFPKTTENIFVSTGVLQLVIAAYLLDHPGLFFRFSERLIMDYTNSMPETARMEMAERVSSRVWLFIESRRNAASSKVMEALSKAIQRPCTADFKNCARISDWYSKLTQNLRSTGLDNIGPNTSLTTLLSRAESLALPLANLQLSVCGTTVAFQGGSFGSNQNTHIHPNPTVQFAYNTMLAEARAKCKGLCLDCVKGGGSGKNCRLSHK